MKKITATILSFLAFTAAIFPATGLFAQNSTKTATADDVSIDLCAATKENYAAVACENQLYLFNDEVSAWQEYEHSSPVVETHFGKEGILYFLDAQSNLFTLNVPDLQSDSSAQDTGIDCSSFTVFEDVLYYANVSAIGGDIKTTLRQVPLTDVTAEGASFTAKTFFVSLCYGENLYALDGGAHLYQISFADDNATELCKLPEGANSILLLDGTLFCATESGAFYGYSFADLTAKKDADACQPIVSVPSGVSALNADENFVYLMQGTTPYVYSTTENALAVAEGRFSRPSLHGISTKQVKSTFENLEKGEFTLVQTKKNALLIEVDLTATQDDSVFPYIGNQRADEKTAIKIASVEGFDLIVEQPTSGNAYSAYLVAPADVTELTENILLYDEEKTGYITNQVGLYKYPLFGEKFPTLSSLSQDDEIILLGEIDGNIPYFIVRSGETVGYIPQGYVNRFLGASPEIEEIILSGDEKNIDGVWRLAYLVLGAAAICILVDFLILRKKSDE